MTYRRAVDLFHAAVELTGDAREAFLDAEVGGDVDLLREVQELLAADDAASVFLENGPLVGSDFLAEQDDHWVGRRFGPYEAVRELGRGGVGVVLLGERADGRYTGQVAIKVVHTALMRGELVDRFHTEGQILADLDHPNVARLLDAGDTDDGLSYLIMEYVDGPRINVFADQALLDVPARLRLFRSVLEGVDYAHARGVIHRDLKPSNILVTADGRPKLVDFGIAKLFAPSTPVPSAEALTQTRMMTPEYASPEQIRGIPVAATSDIYSLGVVLYRLLTGRHPYALPTTQPSAAEKVICEESPPRPSTAITRPMSTEPEASTEGVDPAALARNRSSTLDRLQRALRGDLDTIVLKALAKEPEARYATAGAFGDDIERHLDGRPIRAHPPTATYRLRSFVHRRRGQITLAVTVAVGLGLAGWQATLASSQREQAEAGSAEITRLASSVMSTLDGMQIDERGPTAVREEVVTSALASLSQLVERMDGDPSPEALMTLARAYGTVGDVQGSLYGANVGKPDEATISYQAALELLEGVVADAPETDGALSEVAWIQLRLADIARGQASPSEARRLIDIALPVFDSLLREDPTNPRALERAATAYARRGMNHDDLGETAMALSDFETALALRETMPYAQMDGAAVRGSLIRHVITLTQNALTLTRLGRAQEGIPLNRRAVALGDSLAGLRGASPNTIRTTALAHNQLAWRLVEANELEEAEQQFTEALSSLRSLWQQDVENVLLLTDVGVTHEGRGQARIKAENWVGALEDQRAAIAILEPRIADIPNASFQLAQAYRQAGESLTALLRLNEAEPEFVRSLEIANAMVERDSTYTLGKIILSLSLSSFETLYLVRATQEADLGSCPRAVALGDSVRGLWTQLTEAGQIAPGIQTIWLDFEARKPPGVCGRAP